MPDEVLCCSDCEKTFKHTERSQAFFAEKGWTTKPKRCRPCRDRRKGVGGLRATYSATCSDCGAETVVSFRPDPDRPVHCEACFRPPQRVPPQAG